MIRFGSLRLSASVAMVVGLTAIALLNLDTSEGCFRRRRRCRQVCVPCCPAPMICGSPQGGQPGNPQRSQNPMDNPQSLDDLPDPDDVGDTEVGQLRRPKSVDEILESLGQGGNAGSAGEDLPPENTGDAVPAGPPSAEPVLPAPVVPQPPRGASPTGGEQVTAPLRVWRSHDGKRTVMARLIRAVDGLVTVERQDGKVFTVPAAGFHADDQQYVQSVVGGQGKLALQ